MLKIILIPPLVFFSVMLYALLRSSSLAARREEAGRRPRGQSAQAIPAPQSGKEESL